MLTELVYLVWNRSLVLFFFFFFFFLIIKNIEFGHCVDF